MMVMGATSRKLAALAVGGALVAGLLAAGALTVSGETARADDEGVTVAKKLAAATVTVRASAPESEPGKTPEVTVFSGVSLGDGLVVTFSSAPETWRYRLTLPDGTQAEGGLRVKDLYSGLSILEISAKDHKGLPALTLADELPDAGSTLYTAAAAGIEKPIVSRGILGAVDRKFSGRELPPLLQCDVRTIETSPGAAVVDREGRLLGIIAINSLPGQGDGWTYAVPVRHVKRAKGEYTKGEVKTIRPQRPVLGFRMTGKGEDSVEVESVAAGGPADKAGIRKGDQVVAVQGEKVRNVYQVVSLVLNHQPGDRMEFTVKQGAEVRKISLTLAAPASLDPPPAGLVGRTAGKGVIQILPAGAEGQGIAPRAPTGAVSLLQREVKRLQTLIQTLVDANDRQSRELAKMRGENSALQRKLGELERGKEK